MIREVFIGFDSAWTDNPRRPGAIALMEYEDGKASRFSPPRLATFMEALAIVEGAKSGADYILIALDQPTLVPNSAGCRPVERVAGSLVNRLKGGVQPANRGKASMFGDDAPIWPFLDAIGARENPDAARTAEVGVFLIEVFPALALPALVDEIAARGRAAKYNPAAKTQFNISDWRMVAQAIAKHAAALELAELRTWAHRTSQKADLRKADQDLLDAAICLLIALMWRRAPRASMAVIGDGAHGYMVTPVSAATHPILEFAAAKSGVAFNAPWTADAARDHIPSMIAAPPVDPLLARIAREPGKLGGKPCIRGMRIGVNHVLEMLAGGMTPKEILADFPDLEAEDIRAACAYGAILAERDRLQ